MSLTSLLYLPVLSLLALSDLSAQIPQQHLETIEKRTLCLTYDYTTYWPRQGDHDARFYLPVPPETPSQHILSFHSTLKGEYITDGAHPPHRLLTAALHHAENEERYLQWHVVVAGVFRMRHLVDGPPEFTPETKPLPPAPGDFLESTETLNWDTDRFQDWLQSSSLQRQAGEASWHLAKRIYTYLKSNGSYEYPPETAWNAAATCRNLSTDCGGFSIVFVSACRANQIPARLRVGQWFKTKDHDDGTVEMTGHQSHVYAEFFDPQLGWVPVDLSSTLLHVTDRGSTDFFGQDPGFFLVWHHDSDFHLVTPEKPDDHVQWMQNPAIWFGPDAKSSAEDSDHHWQLETVP